MSGKENQRVRLSKQCLRESLIELLQAESIHKISVREICDNAGINRTTFYKHYGNQYGLLKDMEDTALAQVDEYLAQIGDVSRDALLRLKNILCYIQDNLDLFRLLINNTVDTDFPQRLIHLPMIRQILGEHLRYGYNENELDYVYGFIVNGGFSLVKLWINKDEREPPERIAALLMASAQNLMTSGGL